MLTGLVFLLFGLTLVVKGADWLVDGSSSLARRLGFSEIVVGLTVVSFGTSMPEFVVTLMSTLHGHTDIGVGNIVGSGIANILLILGCTAILSPLTIHPSTVWREIPFALLASVLLFFVGADSLIDGSVSGVISRTEGLSFLAFFILFLWYVGRLSSKRSLSTVIETRSSLWSTFLVLTGVLFLSLGGNLVVDGASMLALTLGFSEAMIGLTIVAVGTSIPELVTSVVAGYRGSSDIAVGNIIGSNIFNIFWILGFASTVHPLALPQDFMIDSLVLVGATVLLFFAVHTGYFHHRLCFWRQRCGHSIDRIDGVILLTAYVAYVAYLIVGR